MFAFRLVIVHFEIVKNDGCVRACVWESHWKCIPIARDIHAYYNLSSHVLCVLPIFISCCESVELIILLLLFIYFFLLLFLLFSLVFSNKWLIRFFSKLIRYNVLISNFADCQQIFGIIDFPSIFKGNFFDFCHQFPSEWREFTFLVLLLNFPSQNCVILTLSFNLNETKCRRMLRGRIAPYEMCWVYVQNWTTRTKHLDSGPCHALHNDFQFCGVRLWPTSV